MISYEKFKEELKKPKYFGTKCHVYGCNKPAEYESGDSRFYYGVCEEHAEIKEMYNYIQYLGGKYDLRKTK